MHRVVDGALASERRRFELLIARCSGTMAATAALGLPVCLIDVVPNARRAVERFNVTRHGAAVAAPNDPAPWLLERGWDDWTVFPLDSLIDKVLPLPMGSRIEQGRFSAPLPADTTLAEVQEALAGSLRSLSVDEVLANPVWVEIGDGREMSRARNRYVLSRVADPVRARRVILTALDPHEDCQRLLMHVAAACMAAADKYQRVPLFE